MNNSVCLDDDGTTVGRGGPERVVTTSFVSTTNNTPGKRSDGADELRLVRLFVLDANLECVGLE